jgi:two-component system CheB/CheR fusion protein
VLNANLEEEAREVLNTMRHVEKEVRTSEGQWYLMRILPYPGEENRRSGVVLTFVDIKELKEITRQLNTAEEARRYAQGIVETIREPLLVLDKDLKVISANESFYRTFKLSEKVVEERFLFDLEDGQWEIPELRKLLQEVLPNRQSFEDFEVEQAFSRMGKRKMRLNARRIHEEGQAKERILLAIEDVTAKG